VVKYVNLNKGRKRSRNENMSLEASSSYPCSPSNPDQNRISVKLFQADLFSI